MDGKEKFVVIGKITRPHGIKGEVRADFYGEDLMRLDGPVWFGSGRGIVRPAHVESWREQGGMVILRLKDVTDRTQAEFLRGTELLIADSDLVDEEGAPYVAHVIGCCVSVEGGAVLGTIEDILVPAGNEVWLIRASADLGGGEILFPAVPQFVASMDVKNGKIVVDPPKGLLDVYLGEESGGKMQDQTDGGKT